MRINKNKMLIEMVLQGYSLVKFAEVSGVSRATLSAIKNGKTCSINTAAKIATGLGVEVEELLESEV